MNIIFDINHPAHVHLFRNVYKMLVEKGHGAFVVVKEIPSAMKLLDLYGIPYVSIGKKDDALGKKGLDQLAFDKRLLKLVRKHQIDLGVGSSINIPHVSKLSRIKSIILDDDDDEVEPLFVKFGHPFADVILSPIDTPRRSKKKIYVNAYHELAYLHPNRFEPDPSVLKDAGVEEGETYFILRFNAFKAHHDVGVVGLTIENKQRLVDYLCSKGKVFITTERDIDDEFKPYQLKVSPEKAHSLIYYATMLVGDSQTMTSEAAVLGTPAIRCNTFVGRIHYLEEEEHKYGLTYGFRPDHSEEMFQKIEDLLSMPDLKEEWQRRRQKMLSEKIDYTSFLTWFIENYPDSQKIMKDNPNYQFRFK
jgi:predicted glycosyltransferase